MINWNTEKKHIRNIIKGKLYVLIVCILVLSIILVYLADFWKSSHYHSPSRLSYTALANPASVNCQEQGGSVQIKAQADGSQYGLCMFNGGYACEEWQLFRGECDKPIMNTSTDQQIIYNPTTAYCAGLPSQHISETHKDFDTKNYSWQISLPKIPIPQSSLVQIGIHNIGTTNDVFPVIISVTSPHGELSFSKHTLHGSRWAYALFPKDFTSENNQEKGIYTVVYQIYDTIIACGGFELR